MRAFRVLLILGICLFSKSITWAQEPEQHKCLIRVSQTFHGWVKCNSHTPVWLSTDVTISDTTCNFTEEDKRKGYIDILLYAQNRGGHYYIGEKPLTFKMILDAGELNNSPVGDWVIETEEIKVGKKDFPKKSVSHSCGFLGRKSEGFDATTCLIFDNPIEVTSISQDVVVEKEKLELQFNEFYENGQKVELQYRCINAGIEEWQPISNQSLSIRSKGKLRLSYEDVVGKESDSNEAYKNCSGKFIEFRVVKTLLDENYTKTYGNIVKTRFYHKGPEFTIEDIRRPYCEGFTIYVRKNSPTGSFDKPNNKYRWLLQKKSGSHTCDSIGFENVKNSSDLYELTLSNKDIKYLNEDDASGEWELQLQLLKDNGQPESLDFNEVLFSIPPKLDSIKAWQSKDYLFELDGTKYHLYNKNEPYVVLKITDNDTIGPGRLPYKIYNKKDSLLAEITGKIKIDEEKIEKERDSIYAELEKGRNAFDKQCAEEWYNKNQNNDTVRLFTRNSIYLENVGMVSGICAVEDDGFTYLYSSGNVYLKIQGIWGATTYGYEYYYESSNDSYKFENEYGNYKIWHNGNIVDISPHVGYAFVVGNARYLLLSQPKTQVSTEKYFYLYDLTSSEPEQFNSVCSEFQSDLSGGYQLFLYGGDEIIALKNKNIHTYTIKSSQQGNSTQIDLEKKSEPKTTINAPASPSEILIGENSISYTAIDGKSYEEYYKIPSKDDFIKKFDIEKSTLFTSSKFDDRWKLKKERCWKQYYLQHYGYHVHGIKINTEKEEELTLVDNDGCSYTIPYRVNVLDNLQIDEVSRSNPNLGNSADGTATLKVLPGGSTDYYYNGKKIEGKLDIYLTGLHWGDNSVEFTNENGDVRYTHIVSLLPNVTFTTTPQTCSSPNGEISPNGKDAKECTSWQHKNPSMPDSDVYWKDGLGNLKAGTYAVRGKFGDLWVNFREYTVANEVFSVEVNKVKDATEIGGTGSVELNIHNQTQNITWTDIDTKATYTDYKQAIFTARKYNWSATHSSDGCKVQIEFEIKAPKVELVNASVTYNADTKEAHVHVEGKKNDLVSSYQFLVNDLVFHNDTVLQNVDSESEISLGLSYKTTDDNNKNKEICIVRPTTTFAPSAMPDEDNATRCPSELGVINVTNCDYINCEYSIDNGKFQQLSNIKNIEAVDGRHSITFRLHSTEQTDLGNIALYTTHEIDSIDIEPAQLPIITTSYTDVTCLGANDGEIFIIDTQNIRGNAQLSLDGETWTNSAISKLSQGLYTIYQRDDVCPTDTIKVQYNIASPNVPLQITTTAISHPSCGINDGEISVEVSGGWSEAYKVLSDTVFTDDILEDETGYSDEMQHTFKNITGGQHTIYVADAGGCVSSVSTILNDHAQNVDYKLSIADASCFGFVDGSVSIAGIKGFNTVNYTLTKANEIIAQEEVSFEDDNILINNILRAGNDYCLTLRNDDGCIGSDRFYINQPPKIELDLGYDVTICPNNVVQLDAGNHHSYQWQCAEENISNDRSLIVNKSGLYSVVVTDENGCQATDTISVEIGNSALQAYFLMSSDAQLGDTIVIVELSNMQPDNIECDYDTASFTDVTPTDAADYLLYLLPHELGTYNITMNAYADGCISSDTKQISIVENIGQYDNFEIGYAPLIKQAKVSPNPNDGEFSLIIVLRETYDIDVTVYDVNNGRQVEHVVLKDSDKYNTRLNIRQWGSGIFVLSIVSGTERRAIKVLCVR